MNANRVAGLVENTEADAWMVSAGSREILEWFADQNQNAFALFGRRKGLSIAGAGPNKSPLFSSITRRLIELGHRRISLLCRSQLRQPSPAESLRNFLSELESAGVKTGKCHLPDWEENKAGFAKALDSLLEHTPPTALILDKPFLYNAAYHRLARRGLRVPEDVSLVCTDGLPA
ncbi:substrate-binding domain-containing protein [Verrucomicrobiales bacterium]|jgi:DNA-binding LacI/PurR family transcriptional regulator|nr:substrate-binding domain-containing protein [Verrucomicrobiales bacterium]MDC0322403.1 substrate-binding domain-containing protein [Verrucomicrobiales bacterium]